MGKRAQVRRAKRDQGKTVDVAKGVDDMRFQGGKVGIAEMKIVGRRAS